MMRLTVLIDNNASVSHSAEWGLSFLLETQEHRFLFDTGASDLLIQNAKKTNITFDSISGIILSHGHWDHTWGLKSLVDLYHQSNIVFDHRPSLIYHPLALTPKQRSDGSNLGINLSADILGEHFDLNPSLSPLWLTNHLVFLGEIPRHHSFEGHTPLGRAVTATGELADDLLWDDTALAYKGRNGLVIITGCSHSGLCNIVDYAQLVCDEQRIDSIVGGFHLLDKTPENQTIETMAFLKRSHPRQLFPCHCINLHHKIALASVAPVGEIKAGVILEFK